MTDSTDKPRIEFPCDSYPIKIMGYAGTEFQQFVLEVMERHAPEFDRAKIQIRASRNGRFESVNVAITATGVEQLAVIFADLKQNPAVQMVL